MDQHPKPLVPSRSVLRVEDFCRHTGLDLATIEPLMRSGALSALFRSDGSPWGLFDDPLPTAEELRAMGLTVSDDYRPEEPESYSVEDDDADEQGAGSGPTWTMSWGDAET